MFATLSKMKTDFLQWNYVFRKNSPKSGTHGKVAH